VILTGKDKKTSRYVEAFRCECIDTLINTPSEKSSDTGITEYLDLLEGVDREVIEYRYGTYQLQFETIATILSLSRVWVAAIHKRALKVLHKKITNKAH
jgi:DNA-directed RNA polymerase specialized sigma subunit